MVSRLSLLLASWPVTRLLVIGIFTLVLCWYFQSMIDTEYAHVGHHVGYAKSLLLGHFFCKFVGDFRGQKRANLFQRWRSPFPLFSLPPLWLRFWTRACPTIVGNVSVITLEHRFLVWSGRQSIAFDCFLYFNQKTVLGRPLYRCKHSCFFPQCDSWFLLAGVGLSGVLGAPKPPTSRVGGSMLGPIAVYASYVNKGRGRVVRLGYFSPVGWIFDFTVFWAF